MKRISIFLNTFYGLAFWKQTNFVLPCLQQVILMKDIITSGKTTVLTQPPQESKFINVFKIYRASQNDIIKIPWRSCICPSMNLSLVGNRTISEIIWQHFQYNRTVFHMSRPTVGMWMHDQPICNDTQIHAKYDRCESIARAFSKHTRKYRPDFLELLLHLTST